MKIADFVNTGLRQFGDYDNTRSLPHLMDGLKTAQRKVIHTALSTPGSVKVSVLGSKASGATHYMHGEDSIIDVTTGLAKSFPGANNFPLLRAEGQFGNRLNNTASQPRYIYTGISDNFRQMYDKEDLHIVEKQFIDGEEIEPRFFIPKLPMLLVNGSAGVGNGFSTLIFPYMPQDVSRAVTEYLTQGQVVKPLVPFLNGWTGTIKKLPSGQITFTGVIKKVNTTTLRITELPPDRQNDKYKEFLNGLVDNKTIKDYENNSTEEGWDIIITVTREIGALPLEKLQETFKLVGKMTETFCCWVDGRAAPQILKGPEEIVALWVDARIPLYQKRKDYLLNKLESESRWDLMKSTFIAWWNGIGFQAQKSATAQLVTDIKHEVAGVETDEDAFRLLDLKIRSLIPEEIARLKRAIQERQAKIDDLKSKSSKDLMLEEVGSFL